MNKERLLRISTYLRTTDILDWNFADVDHCAYPHFPAIFPGFDIQKGDDEGQYLDLSSKDMSKLFHPAWHKAVNDWSNNSGKLPKTATKEDVAQNIEDFVKLDMSGANDVE